MAELLELIDTLKGEEASIQSLFGSEGAGMRSSTAIQETKRRGDYQKRLLEATQFVNEVFEGKRPLYHFQEAMSTDDFPLLFGDVLDRVLLGNYMDFPKTWERYTKQRTVRDFRSVSRFFVDGGESVLTEVKEQELYPGSSLSEGRYQYSVLKYGRFMPFSWETFVNDDLDALRDVPARFGKAAARSEAKFVTGLFADSTGPHGSLYTGGNGNVITANPALDIAGLVTGLETLANQVDADGEPIVTDLVHLVVPPALQITAQNIMNATQLRIEQRGGFQGTVDSVGKMELIVANWMTTGLVLSVDPYLPIVSTSNGDTSWYLFANPESGRPVMEFGKLRGHETPEIFMKSPNARRIGGGDINPLDGDFERDGFQYKVRHVFGGARMDPAGTVASDGTGS